jgi:cysteine sulfinate desulfinase/cysteine desulfurase-like protein
VREISKILKNFRDESRIKNHELSKGNSNPKSHDSYFIIHDSFPYLLIDASQSVCYEDVSIERLGADILVLDGMKMYGPRGAGVLVIKHGVKISPIVYGGGQEGGLKPGTQNVPAALGLAKALELARRGGEKESSRLQKLRDYAINKILREIPNSSINGDLEKRLPSNINICCGPVPQGAPLDSEFMVIRLDTMASLSRPLRPVIR